MNREEFQKRIDALSKFGGTHKQYYDAVFEHYKFLCSQYYLDDELISEYNKFKTGDSYYSVETSKIFEKEIRRRKLKKIINNNE